MSKTLSTSSTKTQLRHQILTKRRERQATEEQKTLEAQVFCRAAMHLVRTLNAQVVASFEPLPTEPDVSLFNQAVLQAGLRLLLPKVQYVDGKLAEPKWREDSQILEATALSEANFVLIPALAIDYSGTRLGRGGGWYDRALLHCSKPGESRFSGANLPQTQIVKSSPSIFSHPAISPIPAIPSHSSGSSSSSGSPSSSSSSGYSSYSSYSSRPSCSSSSSETQFFSEPLIVAAVFADEILPAQTLPREEHDLPVHGVISEKGFTSFT